MFAVNAAPDRPAALLLATCTDPAPSRLSTQFDRVGSHPGEPQSAKLWHIVPLKFEEPS